MSKIVPPVMSLSLLTAAKQTARVFSTDLADEPQFQSYVSLIRTDLQENCAVAEDLRCQFYCGGVALTETVTLSSSACPRMCSLEATFQNSFNPEDATKGDCTAGVTQLFADPFEGDSLVQDDTFLVDADEFLFRDTAPDFMLITHGSIPLQNFGGFQQLNYNAQAPVNTQVVVVGFGVNFGPWGEDENGEEEDIYDVPFKLHSMEVPVVQCDSGSDNICVGPNTLCDIDVGTGLFLGDQVVGVLLDGLNCDAEGETSGQGRYAPLNSDLQTWVESVTSGNPISTTGIPTAVINPAVTPTPTAASTSASTAVPTAVPTAAPTTAPLTEIPTLPTPDKSFDCPVSQRRYTRIHDQDKVNWDQAQLSCRLLDVARTTINDAALATVESQEALTKMKEKMSSFAGSNAVWVGAKVSKGVLRGPWDSNRWESGTQMNTTFTGWSADFNQQHTKFLNEDLCLAVDSTGGWYAADCGLALQVMCQDCFDQPRSNSRSRRGRGRGRRTSGRRRSGRSSGRSNLVSESAGSQVTEVQSCTVGSFSCVAFYSIIGAVMIAFAVVAVVVAHLTLNKKSHTQQPNQKTVEH